MYISMSSQHHHSSSFKPLIYFAFIHSFHLNTFFFKSLMLSAINTSQLHTVAPMPIAPRPHMSVLPKQSQILMDHYLMFLTFTFNPSLYTCFVFTTVPTLSYIVITLFTSRSSVSIYLNAHQTTFSGALLNAFSSSLNA